MSISDIPEATGTNNQESAMPKPIVIYMPFMACTYDQEQELRRRYPTARFVTSWEDGAVMWQDAIKPAK